MKQVKNPLRMRRPFSFFIFIIITILIFYCTDTCIWLLAVEEKLNELLDSEGGITKRKVRGLILCT